jgi:hypothetical protein
MSWNEADWQNVMFGTNYPKLLDVKRKYDPDNLLWCNHCVGSEVFTEHQNGKLSRND